MRQSEPDHGGGGGGGHSLFIGRTIPEKDDEGGGGGGGVRHFFPTSKFFQTQGRGTHRTSPTSLTSKRRIICPPSAQDFRPCLYIYSVSNQSSYGELFLFWSNISIRANALTSTNSSEFGGKSVGVHPPPPPPRSGALSGLAQNFRARATVARHFALPKQTPWLRPSLSLLNYVRYSIFF